MRYVMRTGRPSKLTYQQGSHLHGNFKNEKHLCDFVENNIDQFCLDVLQEELIEFKKEFGMYESIFGSKIYTRPPRADFMIKTKNKVAIIEAKMHGMHNCNSAIGQLLTYATCYKNKYTDLILLVPKIPIMVLHTIENFELPIKVVLLTEEKIGIWSKEIYKNGILNNGN